MYDTRSRLIYIVQDECPKRQSKCAYCEIDLPFCDLQEHLNFCGTRTEPCEKCGQFVMHKDLQRHEDSNCTYPQPKSTNTNSSASGTGSQTSRSNPQQSRVSREAQPPERYNNFAMNELERILNDPSMSRPGYGRGAAIPRVSNPIVPSSRTRAQASTRNAGITGTKRTTVKKTNNTSQRNANPSQRGASTHQTSGAGRSSHRPDGQDDMDHLLAMHLAHDLNEDDITTNSDRNDNSLPANSNSNGLDDLGLSSLETTTLPCEFCGDLLPVDVLIHHQVCNK